MTEAGRLKLPRRKWGKTQDRLEELAHLAKEEKPGRQGSSLCSLRIHPKNTDYKLFKNVWI